MTTEPTDKVKIVKFAPLTLGKDIQDEKTGENDRATVKWSMRAGYPRATVFTSNNIKSDDGKMNYNKMIIAPFDIISLNLFLTLSTEVLDKKEKSSYREVNCLNTKFENGARTNEKYVQATIRIGLDAEGVAYIMVMDNTKPKIKFDILPPEWLEFKDDNGDEITHPSKLSRVYAKAYIRMLESLLNSEMEDFKKIDFIDGPTKKKYTGNSKSSGFDSSNTNAVLGADTSDTDDVLDGLL